MPISPYTGYKNNIYGQTEKNISLYAPKAWAKVMKEIRKNWSRVLKTNTAIMVFIKQ